MDYIPNRDQYISEIKTLNWSNDNKKLIYYICNYICYELCRTNQNDVLLYFLSAVKRNGDLNESINDMCLLAACKYNRHIIVDHIMHSDNYTFNIYVAMALNIACCYGHLESIKNMLQYMETHHVFNELFHILTHDEELSCKHNEYLISYDVFKLLINKSYNGKRYWDTMSLYYALSHKINNADNSALKFWLELLDY